MNNRTPAILKKKFIDPKINKYKFMMSWKRKRREKKNMRLVCNQVLAVCNTNSNKIDERI
jgi:hypothetical protein